MWKVFFLLIYITISNRKSIASHNSTVMDFLQEIKNTNNFSTLLFLKNRGVMVSKSFLSASNLDCYFEQSLWLNLQIPLLQFDETESYFLKQDFNDNFFTVCYLEGDWQQTLNLLNKLLHNLYHMRYVKILFLINNDENDETFQKRLFQFCWQGKMLNVVAVYASFQTTHLYYRYTHFPAFEIEKVDFGLKQNETIYPDRFKDLKGFPLPIIIGGVPPRVIVKSRHGNGDLDLGGIVGNFMELLKEKRNLTYAYPIPFTEQLASHEAIASVRNNIAELSTGIHYSNQSHNGFSYPLEVIDWCIMMPLPAEVPRSNFILIIFSLETCVLALVAIVIISMLLSLALLRNGQSVHTTDFFLHYNCLRGLLGQAFMDVHQPTNLILSIYLKISLLGLLMTTFYNAFFSSYLTEAPKQPSLLTIEDLYNAKFKVYGWEKEINDLMNLRPEYFRIFSQIFLKEANISKFIEIRDSFNTKYGYMVPMDKWSIVTEQQTIFVRPLFYRPESLCIFPTITFAFPINENSYFTPTLNEFILQIMEVGLLDYWHTFSFYELIAIKSINFTDLSQKKLFQPHKIEDFKFIFMGMVFMFLISTLIFLKELVTFQYRCKRNA